MNEFLSKNYSLNLLSRIRNEPALPVYLRRLCYYGHQMLFYKSKRARQSQCNLTLWNLCCPLSNLYCVVVVGDDIRLNDFKSSANSNSVALATKSTMSFMETLNRNEPKMRFQRPHEQQFQIVNSHRFKFDIICMNANLNILVHSNVCGVHIQVRYSILRFRMIE